MKASKLIMAIALIAVVASCTSPSSPAPALPSPTQGSGAPTARVGTTDTPKPVSIKFWEWFGGAWGDSIEEEAKLFNKQYPWITVEVSHYPNQKAYQETLALAFESGSAPDTFLRRHSSRQVYEMKWAQPLDPWITPEWRAKFPPGSFVETINVWDGKIYSFPHSANKFDRVLYINEDMFREAGLVDPTGKVKTPQTWGDLRSMAKQITESGKPKYYGIGIGIKDPKHMSWWFDLANLAGTSGTDGFDYRTARYYFGDHPAYAQIVELLLGMKSDGSVYPNEGALDDSNLYSFFGQGKYAMFLSGSYSANNLKRDFPDFQNYRIVPLPIPDDGRRGGLPYTVGGQFYISSQTKFAREAWLWLDWVSSRGFHERMVSRGLDYSVYPDLNTPENITDPKKWQAYEAITRFIVQLPFPPARNPQAAWVSPKAVVPDYGDVLVGIYTGQIKDWRQALKDLDARKQVAFEDAIKKAQSDGAKVSIQDFIFADWDPMKTYTTRPNQ
jgi:ABC-type glycerol-3-phosphate transport system substrate-binding protein